MPKETTANKEAIETVRGLIDDIETAMLTTISDSGLVSRPMRTQHIEFDGDLWFLTKKDTSKYTEILEDPRVNVAYAGKSYVSISGTAEFVEDDARKKVLWNKVYEKILDTPYDDPNLVLIRVKTETAEYWESGSAIKMVTHLLKKAVGKGSDPKSEPGINETVDLTETPKN
ncbi:pyridoxamine 5'-phosphate oxidase family protein [Saccharibacillus sp. CPCC 101409]|uniref:pyridoxamine 5'-phosphate oxidase family protein n=1 Tax=Saccharibacillus sp. CPCC 101409 TaxID=3058041 RepID=UPI00267235F3|nr:pyridoxamine 5'-phosphate oxidase family protein [Saccharibacillus sp. CPCC 101409]MDO3413037.1 pyridoxamine 5'-phosphate oxidase family protein [Saccharibacillus sp. CPCC 101409]